jgi:hypothetical protein
VSPGVQHRNPASQDRQPSRHLLSQDIGSQSDTVHSAEHTPIGSLSDGVSSHTAKDHGVGREPAESHGGKAKAHKIDRWKQNSGDSDGVCCFPYLTGNAVFPACSSAGLGFHHFVDLQHALEYPGHLGVHAKGSSSEDSKVDVRQMHPNVTVINLEQLGLTGHLEATQVSIPLGHVMRTMH